ncbi:MAG TPA: hypothetical protein GXX14_02490 [Clostridiaceae bacterium]|nr:hypothetical protein [Clostridiaceae bacterium]
MIELCEGRDHVLTAFAVLVFWTLLAALMASWTVKSMLREIGGIKL